MFKVFFSDSVKRRLVAKFPREIKKISKHNKKRIFHRSTWSNFLKNRQDFNDLPQLKI